MEIVLVRHALPLRIDASHDGGPADPGLAPRGHEQASRAVQALAGDDVTALYTSPMARARETGAPLAEALGMQPVVEPDIAEFDAHDPSYVPIEELRAANDPRWQALARGELYSDRVDAEEFRARAIAAIDRIVEQHPGGRAVLFTHAGVINVYLGSLLGQQRHIWFAPAYVSLHRVGASRSGRRGVVSVNETGHVRDLLG